MKKSTLKKTAFTVAAGAALFAPAILGTQSVSAATDTTTGDYDWQAIADAAIKQGNTNAIQYDQENNTINGAQTMTDPNATYTTNADGSQSVESTTTNSSSYDDSQIWSDLDNATVTNGEKYDQDQNTAGTGNPEDSAEWNDTTAGTSDHN